MKIKDRFEAIINWFNKNMPIAETELNYSNPFELLVAVILSAQCTDKRVNIVTPPLFKRFPTAFDLAEANFDEVFSYIKSISYPNNKAKHLIEMSQKLTKDFGGVIPSDIDSLMSLQGVGRKTANVIASIIYNKPVIAVDTHVFRVSHRLGLSKGSSPQKVEKDLEKYIPPQLRAKAHHWLILHGRYTCIARRPICENCALQLYCKYFIDNNFNKPIIT